MYYVQYVGFRITFGVNISLNVQMSFSGNVEVLLLQFQTCSFE